MGTFRFVVGALHPLESPPSGYGTVQNFVNLFKLSTIILLVSLVTMTTKVQHSELCDFSHSDTFGSWVP